MVNAGDGTHEHPTQALLDAFTMRDRLGGDLAGRRVAIVGDVLHSRVARSNVFLLAHARRRGHARGAADAAAGRRRGVAVPGRRVRPRRGELPGLDAVMMLRVQASG